MSSCGSSKQCIDKILLENSKLLLQIDYLAHQRTNSNFINSDIINITNQFERNLFVLMKLHPFVYDQNILNNLPSLLEKQEDELRNNPYMHVDQNETAPLKSAILQQQQQFQQHIKNNQILQPNSETPMKNANQMQMPTQILQSPLINQQQQAMNRQQQPSNFMQLNPQLRMQKPMQQQHQQVNNMQQQMQGMMNVGMPSSLHQQYNQQMRNHLSNTISENGNIINHSYLSPSNNTFNYAPPNYTNNPYQSMMINNTNQMNQNSNNQFQMMNIQQQQQGQFLQLPISVNSQSMISNSNINIHDTQQSLTTIQQQHAMNQQSQQSQFYPQQQIQQQHQQLQQQQQQQY